MIATVDAVTASLIAHHRDRRTSRWDSCVSLEAVAQLLRAATNDGLSEELVRDCVSSVASGLFRSRAYEVELVVTQHRAESGALSAHLRLYSSSRPNGVDGEDLIRLAAADGATSLAQLVSRNPALRQLQLPSVDSLRSAAEMVLIELALSGFVPRRSAVAAVTRLGFERNSADSILAIVGSVVPSTDGISREWCEVPCEDDRPGLVGLTPIALGLKAWRPCPCGDGVVVGGRVSAIRKHSTVTFVDLSWDSRTAQLRLKADQSVPRPDALVEACCTLIGGSGGEAPAEVNHIVTDRPPRHGAASSISPRIRERLNEAQAVTFLREQLATSSFLEVVTPYLEPTFGGGQARPYTTWQAADRRTQYLRVTSELALLQIVSTGVSRAYEIGPSFRNEGLHGAVQREYVMLEAYAVDMDFDEMVEFTSASILTYLSERIEFSTISFADAFATLAGFEFIDGRRLARLCSSELPHVDPAAENPVRLARLLWDRCLAPQLNDLVALHDIPGSASPLIESRGQHPTRAWFYLNGSEIAEVARNEVDPRLLQQRLQEQAANDTQIVNRGGNDLIAALNRGVPPCVGVGLGIRRLVEAGGKVRAPSG